MAGAGVRAALAFAAGAAAFSGPLPLEAQPAPTFRATCDELPGMIEAADFDPQTLYTIEVDGAVDEVRKDEALVYVFLCGAGDTAVLCITYHGKEIEAGSRVVVAGGYRDAGPGQVILDPCLAHDPAYYDRGG